MIGPTPSAAAISSASAPWSAAMVGNARVSAWAVTNPTWGIPRPKSTLANGRSRERSIEARSALAERSLKPGSASTSSAPST